MVTDTALPGPDQEISVAHGALLTIHTEFLSIKKLLGDVETQAEAVSCTFPHKPSPAGILSAWSVRTKNQQAGTQNTHSPQDAGKQTYKPKYQQIKQRQKNSKDVW